MQSRRRELTTLTDTAEIIVEKIDINYMKMQFVLNITDRAFNNAYSLFVTSFNIKFSIKKFYNLPTVWIYVFCMDLRTNCNYFPTKH